MVSVRSGRDFFFWAGLLVAALVGPVRLDAKQTQRVSDGVAALELHVSQLSALVAEPIELRLIVDAPSAAEVVPIAVEQELAPFEIISTTNWDDLPSERPSNRRRQTLLTLESYRSGTVSIPAIEVSYRYAGELRSLASEPIE
ncbi:MAG: hypothetical protein MI861_25360, partial [Pirellulales bacterium]|nr:hypothetical protein [Pirellulales bacterium]